MKGDRKVKKKRTKAQVGRGSKNKGKGYERKISKLIGDWFCPEEMNQSDKPDRIHRTPTSGAIYYPGDIVDDKHELPFMVECKKSQSWDFGDLFREKSELWGYWLQCIMECPLSLKALLVFSANFKPDYFAMPSEAFRELEEYGGDYLQTYWEVCNHSIPFGQLQQPLIVGLLKDFLEHFDAEMVKTIPGFRKGSKK